MSCSKIFSGDLPELTYEIIKYFQNDFSTLHSCILVNRLWCRLTIPLLWENPFSAPIKNFNFIEIYLRNLNDDTKTKLNDCNINGNFLSPSNTFFNYLSFIKYLNLWGFVFSVESWSQKTVEISRPKNRNLTLINNFKRLTQISLFKMFIENEVNLHNLDVEIFTFNSYITYYNDIFKLMLQNPNFIHNVRNLNLYINGNSIVRNKSEYKLIKYHILQITDLHQNLKRISLSYNNFTLYQSLLLSKDYNCSNTLNTIIFYRIDFKGIVNLNKIFEQLNALESVHIIYCSSLNTGFIQQIISLTKPFKLRSLFLNERSQIDESLLLLLQESGGYLENFECKFGHNYSLSFKQQILGSIMKYCKNIKFLYSCEFENTIMYLMLEFIESMKQNLNYLTFSVFNDDIFSNNNNFEWNSTIIMNLGQVLPSKLEYLNLRLRIKTSDFEVFLKNSQDTFINKLLINNIEGQDILLYIKEYIMKKRRVKYLAIMDYFKNTPGNTNNVIYDSKQLFFLEDEVEEFRLYDIKVQDYYSMVVKAYDFKVRN